MDVRSSEKEEKENLRTRFDGKYLFTHDLQTQLFTDGFHFIPTAILLFGARTLILILIIDIIRERVYHNLLNVPSSFSISISISFTSLSQSFSNIVYHSYNLIIMQDKQVVHADTAKLIFQKKYRIGYLKGKKEKNRKGKERERKKEKEKESERQRK